MSYRTLHTANQRLEFTIVGVLVVAFLLTWVLMFVHPAIAIALFWLGMAFFLVAVFVLVFTLKAERSAARKELAAHHCPNCNSEIDRDPSAGEWHCKACGADFLDSGVERKARPSAS